MCATTSLSLLAVAASLMALTVPAQTAEAAVVMCDGHPATIVGTAGDDTIIGTPGNDVIAARAGNDVVRGKGGNDRICGGYGSDELRGGPGNDRIFGGKDRFIPFAGDGDTALIGDTLRGGTGRDLLVPGRDTRDVGLVTPDKILWDTAPRGVRIDMTRGVAVGTGPDTFVGTAVSIVGSRYGDVIYGTSGNDSIDAGLGSDWVYGLAGDDEIYGEFCCSNTVPGDDHIWGGPGADFLSSYSGSDTFHGGPGNDVLADNGATGALFYGDAGNDRLFTFIHRGSHPRGFAGGAGANTLGIFAAADDGATAVNGTWNMETGEMAVSGGPTLTVNATGFRSADLSGDSVSWQITGTPVDNEVLAGGTGGTSFFGRGGDDTFEGSISADLFDGGPGTDRSFGMSDGVDTCISVERFDQPDCEVVRP
jgi:Ca2+-binding RTX toxin-like protein